MPNQKLEDRNNHEEEHFNKKDLLMEEIADTESRDIQVLKIQEQQEKVSNTSNSFKAQQTRKDVDPSDLNIENTLLTSPFLLKKEKSGSLLHSSTHLFDLDNIFIKSSIQNYQANEKERLTGVKRLVPNSIATNHKK